MIKVLKSCDEARHEHCFHLFRGPIWMVMPDGYVLEKCCKCEQTRLVHAEHRDGACTWRTQRPLKPRLHVSKEVTYVH